MMKRFYTTALAAAILAVALAASARAQAPTVGPIDTRVTTNRTIDIGLPDDTRDKLQEIIMGRSTPAVKNLAVTPLQPKADEPVTLSAQVYTYPRSKGDDTDRVDIIYTTDEGKTWNSVPMEQDAENNKVWAGKIPGQPSGTKVLYGIRALNYSGNMYVEAVCKLSDTPINDDEYLKTSCEGKNCDPLLPRGCMFPMSLYNVDSDDDEAAAIPDELDIREAHVGYTDDKLYIDVATKGRISSGTVSPMNIHIYVAGGINPDKPGIGSGVESVVTQGAAMVYIPVNAEAPCAIYYMRVMEIMQDKINAACAAKDSHLVFTAERKITEPNPSKSLEFIAFDLSQMSIMPSSIPLYDYTHFTRIRFDSRSYTVQ